MPTHPAPVHDHPPSDHAAPVHPVQDVQSEPKSKRNKSLKRKRYKVSTRTRIGRIVADAALTPTEKNSMIARELGTTPSSVAQMVRRAKEKLQQSAELYVDQHQAAIVKALAIGEVGEARKGAWEAIQAITARDDDGTEVRIVESPTTAATMPTIKIGIALGGLPMNQKQLPASTT